MLFEITGDDIKRLNDEELRTLVGYLSEETLRVRAFSPSAVTRGGHQSASDGGIDVRVNLSADSEIYGFVPRAQTGFQVKAQDMPRGAIREEMAPLGVLRESIVQLAAAGGAYIIVSSQGSVADSALRDRCEAMREIVANALPGQTLYVDFYDRERLATWVAQHPGLIPWVREKVGRPLSGWRPFADWSSAPCDLEQPYLLDSAVRLNNPNLKDGAGVEVVEGVAQLRAVLKRPGGIVRLVGLSGVGKTRLVQALFDARVGADALPAREAVYTDLSNSPDPVPIELLTQMQLSRRRVILIVDNCGAGLHKELAKAMVVGNCPVSLLTVEHDIQDDAPEHTDVFRLEPASTDLIDKILERQYPNLSFVNREVIAKFSDGNARIALALARTAKEGESLADLRDPELFRRLFEQAQGSSEQLLAAAKACALLYSFEGEKLDGEDSELARLAVLAGMSVDQLYRHVAELHRRQLVQRRGPWRAILPHALAYRLAKLALEDIPLARIQSVLIDGAPGRVLRSLSRRLGQLHDSPQATELVRTWFARGGVLHEIGRLEELEEAVLTHIAPVDPLATLEVFEESARRDADFLTARNRNREVIVRLLRSIAYEPALFERAALLLARLAGAEGQERFENATEALRSLFRLYLSGSHATPVQRAAVIATLLRSGQPVSGGLGLKLLDTMLSCGPFSGSHSYEFGAHPRDFGAHPHRRTEIAEWFQAAIDTGVEAVLSCSAVSARAKRLLAANLADLCCRVGMVEALEAVVLRLSESSGWPDAWIAVRSALRKDKGSLSGAQVATLERLSAELRPEKLEEWIRAYAFSSEWSALDVADVEEGEETSAADARARITQLCLDLGRQLGADTVKLASMWPEILTSNSRRTQILATGVAAGVHSLETAWRELFDAFLSLPMDARRQYALAGFLEGARQRDSVATEAILDDMLADVRKHPWLLYAQAYAGVGDKSRAFGRMMAALDWESVPLDTFEHLAHGKAHADFDDQQIRAIANRLIAKEGGLSVAREIIGMRIFGAQSDKVPISDELKGAGRDLLAAVRFDRTTAHSDHLLGEVMQVLDAGDGELTRSLCERILEDIQRFGTYPGDLVHLIEALLRRFPNEALDILVDQDILGGCAGSRTIFRDMPDRQPCPLASIPEEVWKAWANLNPQRRYARLAEVVRFTDAKDDEPVRDWSPTALAIIGAAPDPASVLDIFLERFEPTSWSGSRAAVMANRMALIEQLTAHAVPAVSEWARTHTPVFARTIESERTYEARRNRNEHASFE